MLLEYSRDPIMTNMPLAEIFCLDTSKYANVDILAQKLSVRVKNNCKRNHIDTVEDLLNQTPSTLLALRSFGKGCLTEVEQFMVAAPDNIVMTKTPNAADNVESEGDEGFAGNARPVVEPRHLGSIKDETCRYMVFRAMKAYYASALNDIVECLKGRKNVSVRYLTIFTKIPASELTPLMEVLEDAGVVEHWKTAASKYYNLTEEDPITFVAGHGALEKMDW